MQTRGPFGLHSVITISSSISHLELESDDALELLRIARFLGVSAEGLCKVSVTFIRGPLDEEDLYERFHKHARAALAERDAQLDFTTP